jgi:hypothetical protein
MSPLSWMIEKAADRLVGPLPDPPSRPDGRRRVISPAPAEDTTPAAPVDPVETVTPEMTPGEYREHVLATLNALSQDVESVDHGLARIETWAETQDRQSVRVRVAAVGAGIVSVVSLGMSVWAVTSGPDLGSIRQVETGVDATVNGPSSSTVAPVLPPTPAPELPPVADDSGRPAGAVFARPQPLEPVDGPVELIVSAAGFAGDVVDEPDDGGWPVDGDGRPLAFRWEPPVESGSVDATFVAVPKELDEVGLGDRITFDEVAWVVVEVAGFGVDEATPATQAVAESAVSGGLVLVDGVPRVDMTECVDGGIDDGLSETVAVAECEAADVRPVVFAAPDEGGGE